MLLQKRIHEWSKSLEPWQSDLLRRLAAGPLTDDDRAEVRAILLGEAEAPAPVKLALADLPVDEGEHGRVELRRIGNFHNINCLAENQTLSLESGLNVVFGRNGTGKTGHGRLLRGVCRAAEREAVLPNVFEPSSAGNPQTAEILITVDGVDQPIHLDMAQKPERLLSAISVFDASCARVFLTKPNVVDYVPRALVILKALADEQDLISDGLRGKVATMMTTLPLLPVLDEGTAAASVLSNLGPSSDISALEQLSKLNEAETAELEQLETSAATIRADKGGELEQVARMRASGASAAAEAIRDATKHVDDDILAKITDTRRRRDALVEAESELVEKAFVASRFVGAGGEPWLEMWNAIVRYVEAGGGTFPSTEQGALCPTCEQELTPEAASRLADAERFVRSDLRQQADGLDTELRAFTDALPDTQALKTTVATELRGAPPEVVAVADAAVASIVALADRARALAAGEYVPELCATLDLAVLDEYVLTQTQAANTQAALRDPAKQQDVLLRLKELQARRTLHENLPALKERIKTMKQVEALENAVARLGTQAVSLQLRKLQEVEITERLRSAIVEELEHMTSLLGKIEIVGQASKGETKIQVRLSKGCKYRVDVVLSAGEQAALATAFFLAELAVSSGDSAIVLEDPVSSLDHDHRTYLAHRLVNEAKKRQVVIYTHDLTFLVELQAAGEDEGIEIHGQTLQREFGEAGIVKATLPIEAMSPSDRRKDLRKRLRFELKPKFSKEDPDYARAAKEWVCDLRDGYEQVVECYVLAGTVRRFRKQIRMKEMTKMRWNRDLATRIHEAWKNASPKKHFEATELYPSPAKPPELEAMFAEFEAICTETAPKSEKGELTKIEDEFSSDSATQAS